MYALCPFRNPVSPSPRRSDGAASWVLIRLCINHFMRWRILFPGLCAVLALAATAGAQFQTQLLARRRFLPEVGAGVRAIKRDAAGRYFVLTAPAAAVLIYNAAGQRVGQLPAAAGAAAPGSREGGPVHWADLA